VGVPCSLSGWWSMHICHPCVGSVWPLKCYRTLVEVPPFPHIVTPHYVCLKQRIKALLNPDYR
jgi:hypothetical protein